MTQLKQIAMEDMATFSQKALGRLMKMQKHLTKDIYKINNDFVISYDSIIFANNDEKLEYQKENKEKLLKDKQLELAWVENILKNNT